MEKAMISESRLYYPEEKTFLPSRHVSQGFLTKDECMAIRAVMDEQRMEYATIGNGDNSSFVEDLKYRTVKNAFVDDTQFDWLYDRIARQVKDINDTYFRFDLYGMLESLQYLAYEMPSGDIPAGHYDWHQDYGGGYSARRKLSVSIQLSDTSEYDECDLLMFTNRVELIANRDIGTITVFPSYMPHCVTPIERGKRCALVTWISGPQFR